MLFFLKAQPQWFHLHQMFLHSTGAAQCEVMLVLAFGLSLHFLYQQRAGPLIVCARTDLLFKLFQIYFRDFPILVT